MLKRLREHTNSYLGQVKDIAEKKYNEEEEGFTNKLRHAANFLTLQSGENETRFRSRIIDCWCNGTNTLSTSAESDYLAISDMSAKEPGIQEIKPTELAAIKHEGLNRLLGYEGASFEVPAVGIRSCSMICACCFPRVVLPPMTSRDSKRSMSKRC